MEKSRIEEIKVLIDYAISATRSDIDLSNRCIEREPSESNKNYLRIEKNNLNTLQAIDELVSELEEFPERINPELIYHHYQQRNNRV